MQILGILLVLVQIGFAVHAVRSGRDRWLWIILFVPAIGCAVYFFTEVLPDLRHSRTVRRAGAGVAKTLDPTRDLRQLREQLEHTETVENKKALADECVAEGLYEDAIKLYKECLTGMHAHDPHIMHGLAQAYFESSGHAKAKETLERLIANNPDYESHDGHLLYARTLEALGEVDAAIKEYETLATAYPGEEARARYALLLQQNGRTEQARNLFEEILKRTKRAPRYYRKMQKEWVALAQRNL